MAEFQKVLSEFRRLCEGRRCDSCPILEKVYKAKENYCFAWVTNHSEEAELIIMKWAEENPIKTNRMKFEETFGTCIVTRWCNEAAPGHVKAINASEREFESWLNAEYKGGQDDNT